MIFSFKPIHASNTATQPTEDSENTMRQLLGQKTCQTFRSFYISMTTTQLVAIILVLVRNCDLRPKKWQIGSGLSPVSSPGNNIQCQMFCDRIIVMDVTRHSGICVTAVQKAIEQCQMFCDRIIVIVVTRHSGICVTALQKAIQQLSLLSLSEIVIGAQGEANWQLLIPNLKPKESHLLQNVLSMHHCHASDKALRHLFDCMTKTHWAVVTPAPVRNCDCIPRSGKRKVVPSFKLRE